MLTLYAALRRADDDFPIPHINSAPLWGGNVDSEAPLWPCLRCILFFNIVNGVCHHVCEYIYWSAFILAVYYLQISSNHFSFNNKVDCGNIQLFQKKSFHSSLWGIFPISFCYCLCYCLCSAFSLFTFSNMQLFQVKKITMKVNGKIFKLSSKPLVFQTPLLCQTLSYRHSH